MEKYEGWELHHEAEVEFDEEPPVEEQGREQRPSIALEITTPDETECQSWDFYPVTPLQVAMSIPMMAISILEAYTHVKFGYCVLALGLHIVCVSMQA